ncbi:reverse transcriptase domain-containing protein [Vibrio parahaemolyticus]|uniref:reverse transcriptase domain-containing protein n=1 Tax=Vibrio parahaemolyticus TaxID=670 RepID=UPI00235F3173|nr:reverse transcriptase domain-containing protein [Vibrio parahaemolyticus]HCG5064967.1 RNA-dependent DNA polymerase [Vibrio parahaemolyticus]HCG5068866.1 RNA-dependent DNA polymerase [Vibrio parahaemolyticus]HCG8055102.1 RNA-dependent DNA polymerase [Vibrio parahaemolyticus]HCG8058997.1 RNA-dependent DNA polymerase [Vibrio parahaemolyticus]
MKSIKQQFESYFSTDNLSRIFQESIVYSGGTGIDNINQYAFRKQQDEQIEIISRKMIAGNYSFTKYKLSLISKGRGKVPREISIPTVRDRIALRAMCDFLQERFKSSINFELPQSVVRKIKEDIASDRYSGVVKLDISNFYPSIDHNLLELQLNKRLRQHQDIKNVIYSAVTAPTVNMSSRDDKPNIEGVPQGLSISNILAAIYLQDLDKFLQKMENVKCYRYVDDVLILCNVDEAVSISKKVITKFSKYNLNIHCPIEMPHKSMIGNLNDDFDYLGYLFKRQVVTVKISSIERLKASLVSLFTSYKYSEKKSEAFLNWRVNIRVTGCVFENKNKGWLFFYSQINDEELLHKLDHFVYKLCRRFDVNIKPKKFVRAFKEISHRKHSTSYVPNFDEFTSENMGRVLSVYFGYDLKGMREDQIKYAFHKKISRQVKDLEADIKDASVSG